MTDFANLLGPEPTWLTCKCGELSARVPCWTCSMAETEKQRMLDRVEQALASIPRGFAWATVDAPELPERVKARAELKTIVERVLGARRAIFAGPSGSGKTSLACACLRLRPMGTYVSALRLGTARIQSAAGQGEADLVERAIAAPMLLIDELGGEQKTATNAVRDVVFARHEADLPTWVTTGFRSEQLAEMYGDGLLRRLMEGAYVVQLGKR